MWIVSAANKGDPCEPGRAAASEAPTPPRTSRGAPANPAGVVVVRPQGEGGARRRRPHLPGGALAARATRHPARLRPAGGTPLARDLPGLAQGPGDLPGSSGGGPRTFGPAIGDVVRTRPACRPPHGTGPGNQPAPASAGGDRVHRSQFPGGRRRGLGPSRADPSDHQAADHSPPGLRGPAPGLVRRRRLGAMEPAGPPRAGNPTTPPPATAAGDTPGTAAAPPGTRPA